MSFTDRRNKKYMDFVTKCALKGEEMIADVRAFHPVITGVVVLAMVGIVFGIMVFELNCPS